MVASCARQGKTVSASADWATLGLCGQSVDSVVLASLRQARTSLESRDMHQDLDEARRQIDRQIADLEAKISR